MADGSKLPVLQMPRTRGDCANVPRPCPFVRCRYNLQPEKSASRTRIGDTEMAEILRLRSEGVGTVEIARRTGRHRDGVYKALRRHDEDIGKEDRHIRDEERQEMARMYADGVSQNEIAE